jgi:hypothetical protein
MAAAIASLLQTAACLSRSSSRAWKALTALFASIGLPFHQDIVGIFRWNHRNPSWGTLITAFAICFT